MEYIWVKKMLYIYTSEYYSVIKKNEIMSFVAAWMNLESIILSEVVRQRRNIISLKYLNQLQWCTQEIGLQ